ncbi:MAG TPA: nitrate reductase cytochrome c-type subunit [Acidiferrobacterales bacterium]|jgi:cytochrome c-type protein NapB
MKNSTLLPVLLAAGLAAGGAVRAADPGDPAVQSLRGGVPIDAEQMPEDLKRWQRDRDPIPRDYLQQPPLIPHHIDGYTINARFNKCLTCHSWSKYKEVGATKISLTHFKDRGGTDLSDVSPRRYFCTQCHVPQVDARPLVDNRFQPIDAVSQP